MIQRLAPAIAIAALIPAFFGAAPNGPAILHVTARAHAASIPDALFSVQAPAAITDSIVVSSYYAKVHSTPSTSASFIVLAEQGQRFRIKAATGDWFQIYVMDTLGWVSRSDARMWDPDAARAQAAPREQPRSDQQAATRSRERSAPSVATQERSQRSEPEAARTRETRRAPDRDSPPPARRESPPRRRQAPRRETPPERPEKRPAQQRTASRPEPEQSRPRPASADASRESAPRAEERLTESVRRPDTAADTVKQSRAPARQARGRAQQPPRPREPGMVSRVTDWVFATASQIGDMISGIGQSPDAERRDTAVSRPPARPERAAAPDEKYVQIVKGPVRVLAELNPESPILGMVNRGDHFPLISAGDSWCKIVYNSNEGWIERRYTEIVDAPKSIVFEDFLVIAMSLVGLGALALGVRFTMARFNKVSREWFEAESVEKRLLVISQTDKRIRRRLTNAATTLQTTFTELGFGLTVVDGVDAAAKRLAHFLPDVIAVDWQIAPDVHERVERLLSSKSSTANLFVLFYNTPEQRRGTGSRRLPNAEYLGVRFTDRDIVTLLTPLVTAGDRPHEIRKSVQSSALEGDIADGSLSEVFQFAEIGRKTGCLLLENRKPFGLVFFRDGIIVYAATQKAAAKDAVIEMLNLQEGTFRFVADKEPTTTNCQLPTLAVLMEWTKELDEADGS